ncbi:MAG TPA: glycosyltransferase family 4 protein [Chthoniobacterales bacterium]|nr:glycosyltransferase family 4 protein [Chthoniobacterales bacterium]
MAESWNTEILTTCAVDYMTWENFYPPGTEQLGATLVRRFPVDQLRDVESFNRLSSELHSRQRKASLAEQEVWMRAQGPVSTGLLDYLRAENDRYDAFIFFGYLYATTYFGLPLVRNKAWLQPLAHDEWTIYFSMWDRLFSLPQGFIFNSEAEREFLQKRFPKASLRGPVAGVGIESPQRIEDEKFLSRYDLTVPFLLYVGRIDESKGCAVMFENFLRWKKESGAPHKLLLLGKEVMPVPFHDDIVHLGFVDDEQKWAALKRCDWLVMPSPHESLSMALLEAWSVGRPALVNGQCEVLVRHCQESHGGLWYSDFDEWSAALSTADGKAKEILGRQGKAYVEQRYSWARVEACYLEAINPVLSHEIADAN